MTDEKELEQRVVSSLGAIFSPISNVSDEDIGEDGVIENLYNMDLGKNNIDSNVETGQQMDMVEATGLLTI